MFKMRVIRQTRTGINSPRRQLNSNHCHWISRVHALPIENGLNLRVSLSQRRVPVLHERR